MNTTPKLWSTIIAIAALVGVVFAPAIAQKPGEDVAPAPSGDEMTPMMTMGRMMGAMERMTTMMEQHRAEMQKLCPGQPKQGG